MKYYDINYRTELYGGREHTITTTLDNITIEKVIHSGSPYEAVEEQYIIHLKGVFTYDDKPRHIIVKESVYKYFKSEMDKKNNSPIEAPDRPEVSNNIEGLEI